MSKARGRKGFFLNTMYNHIGQYQPDIVETEKTLQLR